MKITRNTMRADGKTVGEAMDDDAAFLRSIGIPAKDGSKTFDEKKDDIDQQRECFADEFERKILDSMDEINEGNGWLDKDLSDLLPAIRKHAKKLFDRKNGEENSWERIEKIMAS